ncbi:MAG: FtsX-like permease family protein [Asgard group archaeon]|nr:FtsX-like permease family protein [Asgard group archaeon]
MQMLERLKFYYKMLLLNRRNTLIMFLGLGISLAMISEGLIFTYSFQYDAFTEFNKQTPTKQFTLSLSSFNVHGEEDTILSKINNITQGVIDELGIQDRILRTDWFSERGTMLYVDSSDPAGEEQLIPEFNLYGLPADYFSALETILYNGTLPHRKDEVIVVTKRTTIESTNLTNLGRFSLYVPVLDLSGDIYLSVRMGIPDAGEHVNVTGIITSEDFSNFKGALTDDFEALDDYFSDQFILTTHTAVMEYVTSVEYLSGYAGFTCRFAFDLTKIDAFNVAGEISKINVLSQTMQREFEKEGFVITVEHLIVDQLLDFNEEFLIFQLFALLFTTPIIGMALSLTSYSSNLMKKRQKRQISSMLQRGSSRREVLNLLIFQAVEFTVLALLICVIIGYPFAWLMIKSNGFLSFGGTSVFPTINMIILYVIVAAAFILSLLINAKNIWDMSNISTVEAYGTTVQKKPFWEKTFIDVALIVVGIVLWLIVRLQIKGTSAYSFAYGLGTTAPICLILGSILLITRIYPFFVNFIAKIGWKRPKLGILGLSAKRSLRRKSSVIRSLVLISLTFTLIISSMTTTQSYQNYDEEQAYYQLGADILIRNVKVSNDDIKNQVLAIEGVAAGSYLKITSQIITYGELTYSYLVVGIDPEEFATITYFQKDYFDTTTPSSIFSKLQDENDVLIQKQQLDKIASYTGSQITLDVEKYILGRINYTIDVVDTYNFFPRFFNEYPIAGDPVFRFTIIGNYNLTTALTYSSFNIGGDMLVKVKEGYSITEVAESIETELGRTVDNAEDLMGSFEGSLRNIMLYGSLNTSFISSMIVTVAAISLMILIQVLENEMEIAMLKTMGMSPRQLFSLFTTEAATIILFGSLMGLFIGIFSARMFMEILTIDNIIPPVNLSVPPLQIFFAFGLLLFTAISSAALTSWMIFRKDTIKAIKQI